MKSLIFSNNLLTILLVALVEANITEDVNWNKSCPKECSCHLGHTSDLRIRQWMQKAEEKETPKKELSPTNEAYYDAAAHESTDQNKGELLKIAICIFQSSADTEKVLQKLHGDTQALTILQGRGSEEITIKAAHTQHLHKLIYLDIQGYLSEIWPERQESLKDHKVMLTNNVLRPLKLLKYLNLEHITILPGSLISNEIDYKGYSTPQVHPNDNEIPVNLQAERGRKFRRPMKGASPNLLFATPNISDSELVPYKIYKDQQERGRLSIFLGLINLELLRVIDCSLREVYWEMFLGLSKIEYMSLEKNELLFLPEFAFYGTPHLKVLSLAHNKLLNIQSTGLAGLLELQVLDLSHNNFSHLSEFSLPPFPNLKEAYLWHNPIETVFASTFEIMNATTALHLGGENSLELHPSSFQGLVCLKKLVLLNVGVKLLEREQLTGMPQLRHLKMTGEISSISYDGFLDTPMLETLELADCKIKSVSMDAFYGLYRLSVLDLSNNLLVSLPLGVFDQQFSLKELYLQNNSLTELPDGFFTMLTAKIVRLSGNTWHCTCNMKNWLAAATNRIKEVKTTLCNHEHDKGNKCMTQGVTYVYEKKVAPQCHSPEKYRGWSIYHVLRKELRCGKSMPKKFNRKEYLKKKYKEYERTNKLNDNSSTLYSIGERTLKHTFLPIREYTTLNPQIEGTIKKTHIPILAKGKLQIPSTVRDTTPIQSSHPVIKAKVFNTSQITTLIEKNKSLMDNKSEQEIIDNTLSILPNQQKKIITFTQRDETSALSQSAPPKTIETLHKVQSLKTSPNTKEFETQESNHIQLAKQSVNNDSKQLKKAWKSQLQRKRQEKLKNFQALS